MNIVCIGAHQDDESGCLGTLLKYRATCSDVAITNVSVSNGDKGAQYEPSMPYERVAAMRNAEANAIAEAIGAHYICLGQSDEYIRDTDEVRNQLVDILRAAKADVVFSHPPEDYNTDHVIAGQLAFHACMLASVRSIFTDHPPLDRFPVLFYMDTLAGLSFQPTHYVDITDFFTRKCELLRLYKSQMTNMEQFGGEDLIGLASVLNRLRGMQCGVGYAEGFRPALAWPRVRPGCPLP